MNPTESAQYVRKNMPADGFFAGHEWRVSPTPFPLDKKLAAELETLGRVLLQFNRAVNLLYRHSLAGKQPAWVAAWLDQGKPAHVLELQRDAAFKNDVPRVIRPDIVLTEDGGCITELDSVPGGIGLTAWLNQTYAAIANGNGCDLIGGADGMLSGFAAFLTAPSAAVNIIVSELKTGRKWRGWPGSWAGASRCATRASTPSARARRFTVFSSCLICPTCPTLEKYLTWPASLRRLTAPPKPIFEEKMLFALLWNRNLRGFWRQELGEGFLDRLLRWAPYTWVVDPAPLPPHGAVPELGLTDWRQLAALSQRERDLILKVSGFSENAWGARGVYLGSDLSQADWSAAVDLAIRSFPTSPFVLQRYRHPSLVQSQWLDFTTNQLVSMPGRVRLCPYYFVVGEGDAARARLAGVLATICPADKKIIHGMSTAILAPCCRETEIKKEKGKRKMRSGHFPSSG